MNGNDSMSAKENLKNKNSNSKLVIIIVVLCVIIVAAGVIIWNLLGERQSSETKRNKDFVVNEDNVDEVLEKLNEPKDDKIPASYDVMMNSDWNFPTATSESSNAQVANSTTNKNIVYFDVYLEDTKEVVYSSPYLKVGDKIRGFKLDKELEKGKYSAICKYYILDDDLNELCTVSVNVTLNIGKK